MASRDLVVDRVDVAYRRKSPAEASRSGRGWRWLRRSPNTSGKWRWSGEGSARWHCKCSNDCATRSASRRSGASTRSFGYRLNDPERPGSSPMPGIIGSSLKVASLGEGPEAGRIEHDLAAARRPIDGGSDGDHRPGRHDPSDCRRGRPTHRPLGPIVSRRQPGLMPFGRGIPSSSSSRALRSSSRARSVPQFPTDWAASL